MDSPNLYQLQLQSQPQHLLYSSSSTTSSSHGVSSTLHDWNPTSLLDGYEFTRYMNEILPNSPSLKSLNCPQEIRFGDARGSILSDNNNFLKLSDMNGSYNINNSYGYIKNEQQDLNQNLSWLMSSNGVSSCMGYNSNLYGSLLTSSSSPSLQLAEDHILMDQRNSLSYSPSNSTNKKTSTFRNEASSRTRKLATFSTNEGVAKKPRLSSSSSCPTLKVRKQKLGERIAGLHRLISPFGKTDTASVLTESIGYIQFLQNQIQTLSMSYMKSSRKKSGRTTPRDVIIRDIQNQKEDEGNIQDLRSRGLCLVPLTFTSYICSFNGSI